MAEIEIKRTNFFDGQFLKQAEFLDLDAYHLHMRRRWAFLLFNQSGVIQASASDLAVEVPNAAQKNIRVRAGMAIGKRPDLMEAKEVVLRDDTPLIDLTVLSPSIPSPLQAGDTGIVTVQYVEEPVAQPPSDGDVPGDTRIKEHAQIVVHRNNLPIQAPNSEPLIILGQVPFNTMLPDPTPRQVAFLNAGLFSVAATPVPTITSTPGSATRNTIMTITGTNFIAPVKVTFNNGGAFVSTFTGAGESLSPTQIKLNVPAAAATGTITVSAAGGTALSATIVIL